jgi:hypothetical protein
MLVQAVQSYVAAFAQLALGCTFGLAMAISIAGVSRVDTPFACRSCATVAAPVTLAKA